MVVVVAAAVVAAVVFVFVVNNRRSIIPPSLTHPFLLWLASVLRKPFSPAHLRYHATAIFAKIWLRYLLCLGVYRIRFTTWTPLAQAMALRPI